MTGSTGKKKENIAGQETAKTALSTHSRCEDWGKKPGAKKKFCIKKPKKNWTGEPLLKEMGRPAIPRGAQIEGEEGKPPNKGNSEKKTRKRKARSNPMIERKTSAKKSEKSRTCGIPARKRQLWGRKREGETATKRKKSRFTSKGRVVERGKTIYCRHASRSFPLTKKSEAFREKQYHSKSRGDRIKFAKREWKKKWVKLGLFLFIQVFRVRYKEKKGVTFKEKRGEVEEGTQQMGERKLKEKMGGSCNLKSAKRYQVTRRRRWDDVRETRRQ